jgi:hypothetical protein
MVKYCVISGKYKSPKMNKKDAEDFKNRIIIRYPKSKIKKC